ncbi:phosphoenolpyruvate carboxylase [Aestuariibacter sp. A3R04]|uniref:phosphoenolpyruvate carboxylase n=1 Tax=Aestuariibacter sp. A3R04 TaxID=2841571 RepID=UPI001C08B940|nr:phosphoenolpyruvate carboxylase [Aestuariibacter sp. A3R04]MBU3022415.1 phosphoenolpyruvate carboxylase [Aestuariibacter sp. A3R04]
MSQPLIEAGTRLLNAMGRHSDLIMQAYITGSVNESDYSRKVLDQLVQLGVLWRPDPQSPLRLKNAVRTLLEGSLQDDRNRTITTNITASLASLRTLAEHYKEALHYHRFNEAHAHMGDLTEHVYQLTESLTNSVRVLFSRINNEFGYVSSVEAKIRENELAQGQVSDLLQQLESFHFDQLSELAGSNRELRHLLVVALQQSFAKAAQELSVVQARLLDLLGRFREFQGRTRILKGFLLHMEQQPDFAPSNYAALSQIPVLFNQSNHVLAGASADVNRVEHETEYQSIVSTLTDIHRAARDASDTEASQEIDVSEQTSISLEKDPIHLAVDDYFCDVIDSGQPKSALSYYAEHDLPFDPEVWLYQVIGGYQALDDNDKRFFALDANGEPHRIFSGNFYINDVTLGLR